MKKLLITLIVVLVIIAAAIYGFTSLNGDTDSEVVKSNVTPVNNSLNLTENDSTRANNYETSNNDYSSDNSVSVGDNQQSNDQQNNNQKNSNSGEEEVLYSENGTYSVFTGEYDEFGNPIYTWHSDYDEVGNYRPGFEMNYSASGPR